MFGIEQEYTFLKNDRPLGWPANGEDGRPGHRRGPHPGLHGRRPRHRGEFQIGVLPAPAVGDHLWLARWLRYRIAENYGVVVSLDAKPVPGDWNGTGAHTNFSTKAMREGYDAIITGCEALGKNTLEHIENYGPGIKERLTGAHETARWDEFSYGPSDRGASVRIPWGVEKARKGWLEDRRPNANMDPYTVTRLIIETCCGALAIAV